jgi:hypothetical protein
MPHSVSDPINRGRETSKRIFFVICNTCLWCASYYNINRSTFLSCYACSSKNTEVIPIGIDECFRIEYTHTRKIEIEFYKDKQLIGLVAT